MIIDPIFKHLCQRLCDRDGTQRGVFVGPRELYYMEFVKPGKDYIWKTVARSKSVANNNANRALLRRMK